MTLEQAKKVMPPAATPVNQSEERKQDGEVQFLERAKGFVKRILESKTN